MITENTARFAGGTVIQARLYDMLMKKHNPEDEKSGDEIVMDIVERAGLELA